MDTSARAPGYDLFKLIVAIILLLIFLFLLFWFPGRTPQSEATTPTAASPPPTLTAASPASTSVPPTLTTTPSQAPSLTATPTTATDTPSPAPTLTITLTPTPTQIVEIPSEPEACEAISRSRLGVGMNATILRRLNFRSSPGIHNNWILTNRPNTRVEIVGGPVCTRYSRGGAYLWWQIKLPDGRIGWSAEASIFGAFYFMEPVK